MSNDPEVFIKGGKQPTKIVLQGDMSTLKLVLPYNNPNVTADDIEITAFQLLEILRVNHLIPFFVKKAVDKED